MNSGTCLCGDITWAVDGDFSMLVNCHCSICRKVHGSAYATFAAAPIDTFRWTAGEEKIRMYKSSEQGKRPFCPRCGSSVAAIMGDIAFMPAGNLDGHIGRPVDSHIFVGSKADWFEITDNAQQIEAYPPDYDVPPTERAKRPPGTDGMVGGSCDCGKVSYEYAPPAQKMGICHCSRCRKARSAAFSTQVFVPIDSFRWISGEDNVDHYRVPDSRYFVSSFCSDCGSPAAKKFEDFSMVMLPAGSLDQDPGIRPQAHIYVASKAPWFDITDDLPQFNEMPPQ